MLLEMCSVLKIIPLAESKGAVTGGRVYVGVIVEVGVGCGVGCGLSGTCM